MKLPGRFPAKSGQSDSCAERLKGSSAEVNVRPELGSGQGRLSDRFWVAQDLIVSCTSWWQGVPPVVVTDGRHLQAIRHSL